MDDDAKIALAFFGVLCLTGIIMFAILVYFN